MSVRETDSNLIGCPILDLTALKAIDTTGYTDGVVINVSQLGFFRFQSGASDTPDDVNIVQPTTGGGRWKRLTPNYMQVDGSDLIKKESIADIDQDLKTTASPSFSGVTIGSLNGHLSASSGVVSGSATHNTLNTLQGGTTNEYYHLTSAQHTNIGDLATLNSGSIIFAGGS